ncbi:rhodanese-related sulfurtransferase [Streptosporangium album]|uniref:Rhodanese-related sulfurtransferase n=2 Tax=Streptosporangium album TaxID=47479 RepID=A0A7W7RPK7_9ACTN|nr:rhodanese-related sulfurtransferase [Streptosporangium album]
MTIREITVDDLRLSDLTGTVPLDELDTLFAGHAGHAGRSVVAKCRSGRGSAVAAQAPRGAGARVWSPAGGTNAWQRAALPLERGRRRPRRRTTRQSRQRHRNRQAKAV